MKIKTHIYESLKADIETILESVKDTFTLRKDDPLGSMWQLLKEVSFNRAYDDNHPAFEEGKKKRLLPYDGRDYCWYYQNGCNDDHVATMLRAIQRELTHCHIIN